MFRYCFNIFQGVADFLLKNTLHSYLSLRGPLPTQYTHGTWSYDFFSNYTVYDTEVLVIN